MPAYSIEKALPTSKPLQSSTQALLALWHYMSGAYCIIKTAIHTLKIWFRLDFSLA